MVTHRDGKDGIEDKQGIGGLGWLERVFQVASGVRPTIVTE